MQHFVPINFVEHLAYAPNSSRYFACIATSKHLVKQLLSKIIALREKLELDEVSIARCGIRQ